MSKFPQRLPPVFVVVTECARVVCSRNWQRNSKNCGYEMVSENSSTVATFGLRDLLGKCAGMLSRVVFFSVWLLDVLVGRRSAIQLTTMHKTHGYSLAWFLYFNAS